MFCPHVCVRKLNKIKVNEFNSVNVFSSLSNGSVRTTKQNHSIRVKQQQDSCMENNDTVMH
jgi:hypothetical protein